MLPPILKFLGRGGNRGSALLGVFAAFAGALEEDLLDFLGA